MISSIVDNRRVMQLNSGRLLEGPVAYIMSRDQRVDDNWALLYSQEIARASSQSLIVVAYPFADYPGISSRQVEFSIEGLRKIEKKLSRLRIPMFALSGEPVKKIPALISTRVIKIYFIFLLIN